jgi:hypothetical protein
VRRTRAIIQSVSLLLAVTATGGLLSGPTGLAVTPAVTQSAATGLSVTNNSERKTAGLGFVIQDAGWPQISLPGGVTAAIQGALAGPAGIELGALQVPGAGQATLASEATDSAHNELTFSYGSGQLELWASRLTPAALVNSSANTLDLFAGNVARTAFNGTTVTAQPAGLTHPKYAAWMTGGSVSIHALSSSPTAVSSSQNWLLLWFGTNSHFVDTKKPLLYTFNDYGFASSPQTDAYQADAPVLLVFQNAPTSIRQSPAGGVELGFSAAAGYFNLLPLLGQDHPRASQTETWATGLPADILQKAQWWSGHLCDYPATATETYSYSEANDTVTVTESFAFLNVCSTGVRFAPLPPMLAVAASPMGIAVSGPVVDAHLNTEFGPTWGVENTQTYNWSLSGLKRYTDATRIAVSPSQAPAELIQELDSEVTKIIAAGHYAPWLFADKLPTNNVVGDLYWANPADGLLQLSEVVNVLSEPLRSQLINYIRTERTKYPPETVYNLPLNVGKVRPGFSVSGADIIAQWTSGRPDVFLKSVPPYNLYALAGYYALTKDPLGSQVFQRAGQIIDAGIAQQDWATFYWFDGFQDRSRAVVNANRHFAGLVGYVRLATMAADQAARSRGMALLAKAAVLRVAMASYTDYLYAAGLVELPPMPDWQIRQTAGQYDGHVFNYNWSGPEDDVRQVAILNQFEVRLADYSGTSADTYLDHASPYLTAFRDATPEVVRLLSRYKPNKITTYLNRIESLFPQWYAAFAEGALGLEHNLQHPSDSFQTFMLLAWLGQTPPSDLASYADIPWLREGDFFYVQKLAETVRAYNGTVWSDSVALFAGPSDHRIALQWNEYQTLPPSSTWTIDYTGPAGDQPSPITGLPSTTRSFTLTALTNNTWYEIRVTAINSGTVILTSDPVRVFVTKYRIHLPTIVILH